MESHHSSRPSRLEKQEEFEIEEEGFALSPVTIQIEDRGSNQEDDQEDKDAENLYLLSEDDGLGASGKSSCDLSPDAMDRLQEVRPERRKASSRVKLLVRSHAVHDDASPPSDIETIIANTNMLSVTNASSFSTQTQSKGASNKYRLDNQSSSQGSTESSSASGLSRDSSTETYTDSSGVDLQQFIVDTLHKNQKDRLMLLKVEQELILLIKDNKRQSYKFPQMSSYNRMLVHRVAAYFGLDHYVDGNGTAVIVNKTKTTRIPDSRFQEFIRDELLPEEPKKSILKRDSISFEEGKEKSPERQSSTDSRRSKSFEEREEEYEKARARIFNQDEGFGESPFNRSQEGTYSSSRRSSQEDVRWPSSETRPWSSTDSDSSGRPLNVKLGGSFETDTTAQIGKSSRSLAVLSKVESENKSFLVPTKPCRPAMTKASSFGGISVLSRENSGRSITPRITKAESFNVTTISSSLTSTITDKSFDNSEVSDKASSNPATLVSSVIQPVLPSQFSVSSTAAEETFPVIAGQPTEIKVSFSQDSCQQVTSWQSENQDSSKDFNTHTVTVGQPLMWPYSTGTDVLLSSGVFVNPLSGNQRVVFPYQPVAVSASEQVSSPVSQGATGTSLSPSSQSSQRQQTLSTIQSSVQQSQPAVNTSSSSAVFYVPCFTQIQYTAAHQSVSPVQSVRHPTASNQFLAEPRPLVLFPVCYIHQSSNVQPVRHVFPSSSTQNVQNTGIQGQNITEMKTPGTASSSFALNPQFLPCFPSLPCTQSAETTLTTAATALYAYGSVMVGNQGNTATTSVKQQFTSQSSQPPVCVQQSAVQLQSTAVTLPPVYVSITSSTQSPATRTHAGGHVAAQFSSFRSHSLPVSTSCTSSVNHQFNSGTPFLGYTVYGSPIQSIPTQSSLIAVTINQNTRASALPSQFAPAYVSAFQVLKPNVPLIANIGNNSHIQNTIRSQFSTPICTVSNVPMSFPLVKQASDPGIGEHLTLSTGDICLVGPPVQHLRPLILAQQPSISRFPRASISHHSPANRPPKNRKHRSKGTATAAHASQSIFELGGNHILEVEGLPEDMKRHDIERYLEAVTELGAKIHFLHSETFEVIDESSDFLANSKYVVLAVFESDTAAQNALLSIKTTKFQLRRWHRSQDSSTTNKI